MSIRSTVRKSASKPLRAPGRCALPPRFTRLMMVIALLISTLVLSQLSPDSALAQQNARALELGSDFKPSHDQIQTIIQGFQRTTEDKVFFHWTTPETGMRWIQQGHIDQGEVDFYNTPSGDRQVHGAGVYMASNPTSSAQFGEFCVVFKMSKGTLLYSPDVVKRVFGRDLNADEKTVLGKSIPFIRDLNGGDWYITHSPSNLARVEYGGPYGGDAKMFSGQDQKTMLAAIENAKPYGDVGYLESFFHLMHYMDGIALQRAIRVAPSNPWSQFEPALFENFRKMNHAALSRKAESHESIWGAEEKDRDVWVDRQLKQTLPGLINGLYQSQSANFRGHEIRAGGTREGHSFYATPQDLVNLLKNPYLSVDYRPDGTGLGFLVSYQYPSIYSLPKLKTLVSADVFEELSKYSIEQIRSDHALEVRLNQTLINDLVRNLLNDVYGKVVDPADFLRRYISIHPYSDGNGRSGRLFIQQALNRSGKSLPPFYISDLDLLVSTDVLNRILADSNSAYIKLQKAMLGEFIASGFGKKRMPDYFKLSQFRELLTSLSAFGFTTKHGVEARYDQDIYERRFNEIFSQKNGPAWSLTADKDLAGTLEFARKNGAPKFVQFVGKKISKLIASLAPDDSLITINEVLKSMIVHGSSLREYPSLKRAYIRKISTIVRKLDYSKLEHFKVLDQYKEITPPEQQRETLGFIARGLRQRAAAANPNTGIDWEVRQKQEMFRTVFQMSELKFLFNSILNGSISPSEFAGRLAQLDASSVQLEYLEIDFQTLHSVLKKLTWQQRTQLLKRLNLGRAKTDETLVQFLKTLAAPVLNVQETEAIEYRRLVSEILQTQITRFKRDDLMMRLMYDLFLRVTPNLRYSLASISSYVGDSVYQRMAEILTEDLVGRKALNEHDATALMNYTSALVYANKRLPIDTKSWIAFLSTQRDRAVYISEDLKAVYFKSSLYYALLQVLKDDEAAKLELFNSINSNSRYVAGGEQLRLELLKEAKRVLNADSYVHFAQQLLAKGVNNGYEKLIKKTTGAVLKPILSELAKATPDFSTHHQVLIQQSQLWARLNDHQIYMILKDKKLLDQIVGSTASLKTSDRELSILKSAMASETDATLRKNRELKLRSSYLYLLRNASDLNLKRETLGLLLRELKSMGPLSASNALSILKGSGAILEKKMRAQLSSSVRSEFLKSARAAASGKMTGKNEYAMTEWAIALADQSFTASEIALITQATRMTDAQSMSVLLNTVPREVKFAKSDYVKGVLGAFSSLSGSSGRYVIAILMSAVTERAVISHRDQSPQAFSDLRDDLVTLFARLPLNVSEILRLEAIERSKSLESSGYTEVAQFMRSWVESSEFKREVYKARFGRDYAGPRTCQAVFSSLMN